jgi:hypothetical protein
MKATYVIISWPRHGFVGMNGTAYHHHHLLWYVVIPSAFFYFFYFFYLIKLIIFGIKSHFLRVSRQRSG